MDETDELFRIVKYSKVRLTVDLASALTAVAAVHRIPRQRLLEGLLAQALIKVSPKIVEEWTEVHALAGLSGVPSLTPPAPKAKSAREEYLTQGGEWE
jgi:hypothetical protein